MAFFYPRKQTVIILVVSVLVVATSAIIFRNNSTAQPELESAVVAKGSVSNGEPIITNYDWKKQFYEASTSNSYKATNQKTVAVQEKLTPTDQLGRNFLSKYVELKQSGLSNNQVALTSSANELLAQSLAGIADPKQFTLANLKITQATDQKTLESYQRSVSAILVSYVPNQDNNEAVLAEQAMTSGDMSILKKIDPVIVNYRAAINTLLSMNVPDPIKQSHLDLVNGLSIELMNAKVLRNLESDPVSAMKALTLEMKGLQLMSDAVGNIRNFYASKGLATTF